MSLRLGSDLLQDQVGGGVGRWRVVHDVNVLVVDGEVAGEDQFAAERAGEAEAEGGFGESRARVVGDEPEVVREVESF